MDGVFKAFYEAFVHSQRPDGPWYECRYSATAHAIVLWSWNGGKISAFQEDSQGGFVEDKVIETLNRMIQEPRGSDESAKSKPKLDVRMYLSLSPGRLQSQHLRELKQNQDCHVELEIIFPSLYKIQRDSCLNDENCQADHVNRVPADVSNQNKEGLRMMKAAGIKLRVFSDDDYTFVARYLGVKRDRQYEDARMAEDLEAILRAEAPAGGQPPEQPNGQDQQGGAEP